MPKTSFDLLGLLIDMRDRLANVRTYCLAKVIDARGIIYGEGNTVDGSKVQATLGEGSWVPTVVSVFEIIHSQLLPEFPLERIWRNAGTARIQHIPNACCRFYARMRVGDMESLVYTSYPLTIRASQR